MASITTNNPQDDTVAIQIRDFLRDLDTNLFDLLDSNERIQQQLAVINEDANLAPGERRFDA